MRAACRAFDEGDVARALRRLRRVPLVGGPGWADEWQELLDAGPDAPGWLWCRAVMRQAYRFVWFDDRELVSWEVAQVLAGTYPDAGDEHATARMVAQAVGMDELVRDSVLFDRGGLARYLTTRASESLLARMPLVGSWTSAARSVFQIGDVTDDRLTVTDLATRRQHTLLHLGAAVGLEPHACVVGRLAPSGVEPEEMFVSRPLHVDESTAVELAEMWRLGGRYHPEYAEERDPLPAIATAVAEGRMPQAPGLLAGSMCLTSDLQPHPEDFADESPPAPRTRELMEAGMSRMDADHVVVVEMALLVAQTTPAALPVAAAHAAIALAHESVREAVRAMRRPDDAAQWARLARCVQEPVRSFCLEMAQGRAA